MVGFWPDSRRRRLTRRSAGSSSTASIATCSPACRCDGCVVVSLVYGHRCLHPCLLPASPSTARLFDRQAFDIARESTRVWDFELLPLDSPTHDEPLFPEPTADDSGAHRGVCEIVGPRLSKFEGEGAPRPFIGRWVSRPLSSARMPRRPRHVTRRDATPHHPRATSSAHDYQ